MKFLLVVAMSFVSMNLWASKPTDFDGLELKLAHCHIISMTGTSEFKFLPNESKVTSTTESVFGHGIEDEYYKPEKFLLAKKFDAADLTAFGVASVRFKIKEKSPSYSNFTTFDFVVDEVPHEGTKVYSVTLVGAQEYGQSAPRKIYYRKIGLGNCELHLETASK